MATAATKNVSYMKSVVVDEQRVVLELTLDEAKAVLDLTHNVAGRPESTRRGLTDKVGDALDKVGVRATGYPYDYSGSVTFKGTGPKAGDPFPGSVAQLYPVQVPTSYRFA